MDFALTDEQRLVSETRAPRSPTTRSSRARRENARNAHFDTDLVRRIAAQGYLGAIIPRGVRRRRARLPRPTGSSSRRSAAADSAMRTVVSVQTSLVCSVDPALGHRGAEARRTSRSCARASGSAASGSPSPTPARTPRTSRRARAATATAGSSTARRCGSRWATTPGSRMVFAQTDPVARSTAASRASSSTPTSPASSRRRSTGRWACTAPTPRRSRSTTCEADRDARRGRRRLQGRDERARLGPLLASPRAASGSARAASTSRSPTRASASSSAGRSPRSSSCRR